MLGLWVGFVSFNNLPLSATFSMILHNVRVEVLPATAAGRLDHLQGTMHGFGSSHKPYFSHLVHNLSPRLAGLVRELLVSDLLQKKTAPS